MNCEKVMILSLYLLPQIKCEEDFSIVETSCKCKKKTSLGPTKVSK